MPIEIRAWKFAVPLVGTLFLAAACSSSNNPTADIPTPSTPTLASELSEFFAGPSTPGADDNAAQHIARATANAAEQDPVGNGDTGGVSQGATVTVPVNWASDGAETRTITLTDDGTEYIIETTPAAPAGTGTNENLVEDTGEHIRTFTQTQEDAEGTPTGTLYVSGAVDLGGDNDFLVHGFWLHDPVDTAETDVPLIGVYVDAVVGEYDGSGRPLTGDNLAPLIGSATYSGGAVGLYHEEVVGEPSTYAVWEANAALTASFDTDMIVGTIDTFTGLPAEVASPTVTLGAAAFSTIVEGGFFTGATRAMVEIGDADAVLYTGNWGGKFYVDDTAPTDPAWVAGTFGFRSPEATPPAVTNTWRAFLGTFGAQRDGSPPALTYELSEFFDGPSTPENGDSVDQSIARQTALAADRIPIGSGTTGGVSQGASVTAPVDWTYTETAGTETLVVTITDSTTFSIDTTDAAGTGTNTNLVEEGNDDIVALTQTHGATTPTATLYVWTSVEGTDEEFGGDDDYLAYGFWVHDLVATGASDVPLIGAFVDSNADPFTVANLAGLTGQATYEGGAVGLYHEEAIGLTTTYSDWEADAALTANFDTEMIDGTIGAFTGLPEGVESPTVTLAPATFSTSVEGGFFLSTTSADVTIEGLSVATYTGDWGGKFYVDGAAPTDNPGWVAGTFGIRSPTTDRDFTRAFLGAFAAQLDDE